MARKTIVSRSDVDAGRIDFSGIATGRRLPPVTPGAVLRGEFMEPLGLSAYRVAKDIGVPTNRVTGILNAERGITAETAARLGRYFGTTPAFWMNLQTRYDLERVARRHGKAIMREVTPLSAAE